MVCMQEARDCIVPEVLPTQGYGEAMGDAPDEGHVRILGSYGSAHRYT